MTWSLAIDDSVERERALADLEDVLTGFASQDPALPGSPVPVEGFRADYRDEGWDWPATALTMVGRQRLRNFRELIERALADGVPGDVMEAGVWRGGASILARATLAAHGIRDRKVIVADSFAGLPPPDEASFPADAGSPLHELPALAVARHEVEASFAAFGLLDDQVEFVEGWFRDTIPALAGRTIAVLRLDGDMYESTYIPLRHLWDGVPPGGFVIFDDYQLFEGCRSAVHDFFAERAIAPEVVPIDRVGTFVRKA